MKIDIKLIDLKSKKLTHANFVVKFVKIILINFNIEPFIALIVSKKQLLSVKIAFNS